MKVPLRADDRVLLLGIPDHSELAAMARILSHGVLVALGHSDDVDRARAAFSEFDNVMFLVSDFRNIPWRDGFFSVIVAPPDFSERASLERLLAPTGRIE